MVPESVLLGFGLTTAAVVSPIGIGHIHQTFLVEDEKKYVLQRININVFKDAEAIADEIKAIPFTGKMMTYIMALRLLADFLWGIRIITLPIRIRT